MGGRIDNNVYDGKTIGWWIDTFFVCFNFDGTNLTFAQWPEGGSYYEQDNYTISIFKAIRKAVMTQVKAEHKRRAQKAKQKAGR